MDFVIGTVTKDRTSEVAIVEFGTVAIPIVWYGMTITVVRPRRRWHDYDGKRCQHTEPHISEPAHDPFLSPDHPVAKHGRRYVATTFWEAGSAMSLPTRI